MESLQLQVKQSLEIPDVRGERPDTASLRRRRTDNRYRSGRSRLFDNHVRLALVSCFFPRIAAPATYGPTRRSGRLRRERNRCRRESLQQVSVDESPHLAERAISIAQDPLGDTTDPSLILAINQVGLAEGLALGKSLGINPELLHNVINSSSGS